MNSRIIIFGIIFLLLFSNIILSKNNIKSSHIQSLRVYLLENGNILKTYLPYLNLEFANGGITGAVEMFDWNGMKLWNFEYSTDEYCLHHDIEPLPNGNILMLASEIKTSEDAVEEGHMPLNNNIHPNYIIEVEPTFPNGGNIVWEWHIWDHLIQDYDPTKNNFGIIKDHPELLNINCICDAGDWNHINSIDYNEKFDQILLSVRNQNEIWIIDHSTTIEEASEHIGGRYGRGGDILYRWGNPQVYGKGTAEDQKLFGQHDATWIESGHPGEGNILIFNNGLNRPDGFYSSVDEIVPPIDENGYYTIQPNSSFKPEEPIWVYTSENPTDCYALIMSGAQRLPNGNTLICLSRGFFFEVNQNKETIWEYTNPYPTHTLRKVVYDITRYSPDYPGLVNFLNTPYTPSPPLGPINGEIDISYTYETASFDPNGDNLFYKWDWGDEISDWEGPYESGIVVNSSHIWHKKGEYEIMVKAKDINGYESDWSYPLEISMPKNKPYFNTPFLNFLENHPHMFLLLRQIFGL